MNILKLLQKDHNKIRRLLMLLEFSSGNAISSRQPIFELFCTELSTHSKVEEEVFYAPLVEINKNTEAQVFEAFEEHHMIRALLEELTDQPKDSECWVAKLSILRVVLENHVRREESELFELARQNFEPHCLHALGEWYFERKAQISSRPDELSSNSSPLSEPFFRSFCV